MRMGGFGIGAEQHGFGGKMSKHAGELLFLFFVALTFGPLDENVRNADKRPYPARVGHDIGEKTHALTPTADAASKADRRTALPTGCTRILPAIRTGADPVITERRQASRFWLAAAARRGGGQGLPGQDAVGGDDDQLA